MILSIVLCVLIVADFGIAQMNYRDLEKCLTKVESQRNDLLKLCKESSDIATDMQKMLNQSFCQTEIALKQRDSLQLIVNKYEGRK